LEGRTERWKKPKGNKTGGGDDGERKIMNMEKIKTTHAHANQNLEDGL